MKKSLTLLIILFLSACQSSAPIERSKIKFIKEEKIEREHLVALEETQLLSILKEESNKHKDNKISKNYVIFTRCKIDGTNCVSFYFDTTNEKYYIQEVYVETENGVNMTGEVLSINQQESFSKISYAHGEYKSIVYYETESGDLISLTKGYTEYNNTIVIKKENKSMIVDLEKITIDHSENILDFLSQKSENQHKEKNPKSKIKP